MITRIKYNNSVKPGSIVAGPFVINSHLVVTAYIHIGTFIEVVLLKECPPTRGMQTEHYNTKNLNTAKYRVRKELEKLGMPFNNEVRQKRTKKAKV